MQRAPKIMEKTIELALEGDVQCLKLCLERILPALKSIEVKVENNTYEKSILDAVREFDGVTVEYNTEYAPDDLPFDDDDSDPQKSG